MLRVIILYVKVIPAQNVAHVPRCLGITDAGIDFDR